MGVSGSGFGNYGIVVAIKDDKGYLHVYAHLLAAGVKVGQQVKRGQLIGKQGNTGISSEHTFIMKCVREQVRNMVIRPQKREL